MPLEGLGEPTSCELRWPHPFGSSNASCISTIGPGACFGEIALLRDTTRAATVIALTTVTVAALDAATFKSVSVKGAGCSSEADREKVLAIIESSYTSLRAFDRHVSQMLVELHEAPNRKSSAMLRSLTRKQSRPSFSEGPPGPSKPIVV